MMSETTAAAEGARGALRSDPMAMKPFCGYNVGDYWQHWLNMGRTPAAKLPKVFYVNWFRKDAGGKFMWPGFGDNSRVIEWMFDRCGAKKAPTVETPIGYVPDVAKGGLNLSGLDISPEKASDLFKIDPAVWKKELGIYGETLGTVGARLPAGLKAQHERLNKRVEAAAAGGRMA